MKNIDISTLINGYRKLSPSYGINPYSVTEIELETLLFENNTDAVNTLHPSTKKRTRLLNAKLKRLWRKLRNIEASRRLYQM